MAPTVDQLDAIYCEGWDSTAHAVVGPIPPGVARDRDGRGEEYAVLLFAVEVPQALIEISWRNHACIIWGFDNLLRRTAKRDLRLVDDGRLILVEETLWEYFDDRQSEFSPEASKRVSQPQSGNLDSDILVITERTRTLMEASADSLKFSKPSFGDWGSLLFTATSTITVEGEEAAETRIHEDLRASLMALAGGSGHWVPKSILPNEWSTAQLVQRYPAPLGLAVTPYVRPVWQAPHPMEPDPQTLSFSRAVRPVSLKGQRVLLESHIIGSLQLPTGHVVACDPDDYFLADRGSFTVPVPPGNYRFFVNVARSMEPTGMSPRVSAGGLIISDEQIESWELALLDGEDPRILRDGEAYCFGVDSGTACFMDSSAVQAVANTWNSSENPLEELEKSCFRIGHIGDLRSGAVLITFDSGWGDGCYPVWVGRSANRSVVSVVADMLLNST
ncbi:DUF4241 domain-containing protein [Streptomyces sp. IB2014 016-6]|uniref:DUF4241 domain-containing protein n=1 Tax=Streptomyces sp. IB2014 016-6 TaxID=2517818 RepID=UPI0011CBB9C9|nr:DUF4241 domain-containing protein [Streptomyces sp. IB2014 016-6]TXL89380.1 DUF4241 domain-containing protein [Streptomyces sp. IB2014 016-6]